MAQIRKMDVQLEVKSPADKLYDAFRNKLQLMPKMSNYALKDVKLVQGDWDSIGAVRVWSYVAGGKTETVKEMMEKADDKNKTIVFRLTEGDIMNSYKNWTSTLSITPTSEGSLVKWTVQYEKLNESVPDPITYADFYTTWSKNLDAHLLNAY